MTGFDDLSDDKRGDNMRNANGLHDECILLEENINETEFLNEREEFWKTVLARLVIEK